MLPLYGLTLKRNEFLVIWREPNNSGKNVVTELAKMILYRFTDINVYIKNSTEKALELIKRKKFNKIILISSIGLDLSGKKFVEIVRKILGFDAIVLFFSTNNKHLKWIQDFPNALFTNNISYFEKYIKYYNEKGLLNLKTEIENNYNIKLKFTKNFLQFPKFINKEKFEDIIVEEICQNFRKVIIYNRNAKKALFMRDDRNVEFKTYLGNDYSLVWYETLINEEITLFSNNSYLYMDEKKIVKGDQYMKRWKYKEESHQIYIYYENKNNILNIRGNNAIISNSTKNNDALFEFIDYSECN